MSAGLRAPATGGTVLNGSILYPDDAGVKRVGADDGAILGNLVRGPASGGATGIALDATSDDDVIRRNDVAGCTRDVLETGGRATAGAATRSRRATVPTVGCP